MPERPKTDVVIKKPTSNIRSTIIVHTGDGRGKSSSAFGVMIRSVARGWNVGVVQFMKSGKWHTGEEEIGRKLGVDWWAIGLGFSWDSEDLTSDEAVSKEAWQASKESIQGGQHDLVILDEITYPMNWGWIDCADVIDTVRNKPNNVTIILTGRDAPEALIEIAHTVTEMVNIKHAYEQGIGARKGIDY
jgi:cob(I)alamin adenosyltransferase